MGDPNRVQDCKRPVLARASTSAADIVCGDKKVAMRILAWAFARCDLPLEAS